MTQATRSNLNIRSAADPFSIHLTNPARLGVLNLNLNPTRPMDNPSYLSFFLSPKQVNFVFILKAQMSTFH